MTRFADTMTRVQDNARTSRIARDEYDRASSKAQFESLRTRAAANAKAFSAPRTWALA